MNFKFDVFWFLFVGSLCSWIFFCEFFFERFLEFWGLFWFGVDILNLFILVFLEFCEWWCVCFVNGCNFLENDVSGYLLNFVGLCFFLGDFVISIFWWWFFVKGFDVNVDFGWVELFVEDVVREFFDDGLNFFEFVFCLLNLGKLGVWCLIFMFFGGIMKIWFVCFDFFLVNLCWSMWDGEMYFIR